LSRRPGGSGLVPLGAAAGREQRQGAADARLEARLRRAWLLVVGPTLVHQTRLVRARRGILVVGCWHSEVIPSLRATAEAVWPQLQARMERLWKLHFNRLEIVPCDPPEAETPETKAPDRDPLAAVLTLLREQAKGGWTPRRS
jgi:hypothetical protein